jgi:CubicO group peptidase (beta-lactamase class C family)
MTLPDFARWSLVVLNKGRTFDGQQIVSEAFFDDLVTPNQMLKNAFKKEYKFMAPNGNYRSQYWVIDAEETRFMQVGVHGQLVYFDYSNDIAIVMFGTYPIAKDVLLVRSIGALFDTVYAALGIDNNESQLAPKVLLGADD